MLGSYLLNFFNSTCFSIETTRHMLKMHEIEKETGVGQNQTSLEPLKNEILENDRVF